MTIKISYSNKTFKKASGNTVLFVDENFNINNLKKNLSNNEFLYIKDILHTSDLKKNILVFELNRLIGLHHIPEVYDTNIF